MGSQIPHRSHHKRCNLNRKTRGGGGQATTYRANKATVALRRAINTPLSAQEKGTGKYTTKDNLAAFMAPRNNCARPQKSFIQSEETIPDWCMPVATSTQQNVESNGSVTASVPVKNFKREILHRVNTCKFTVTTAPKTMLALASYVQDKCLGNKREVMELKSFFSGIKFCVPALGGGGGGGTRALWMTRLLDRSSW